MLDFLVFSDSLAIKELILLANFPLVIHNLKDKKDRIHISFLQWQILRTSVEITHTQTIFGEKAGLRMIESAQYAQNLHYKCFVGLRT